MSTWLTRIRYQLFPPACVFCHQPLADDACCPACLERIQIYPRACCLRCGTPLTEALAPGPCGHCLQHPPPQHSTSSLYRYQGAVREAILAWKLQGHDAGMRYLLHAALPKLKTMIHPQDTLIPVPMPLSRMRRKGRHHAADLCRILAGELACHWHWHILRRQGEQVRQSTLSAKARRKNLRQAFALNPDSSIYPLQGVLWLVDDIITTGATVHFAAQALQRSGYPVHVLSVARSIQGD